MIRRLLMFGPPVELLLAGGAAYLAWEHEQGKHTQAHLLCPICWLNKIAPVPPSAEPAVPAQSAQSGQPAEDST